MKRQRGGEEAELLAGNEGECDQEHEEQLVEGSERGAGCCGVQVAPQRR